MSSASSSAARRLILASTSPYRRELLQRLRLPFEVMSPDTDETPHVDEHPRSVARRLALAKAQAVAMQQPPSDRGKRLKIFYMTQVGVRPPTFVIFVNDKELMHFSYTRYIENKVRDAFGFRGTPLKFIIRERGEKS